MVRCDPKHTKLIAALRSAVTKGEWDLDKDLTAYDGILDCYTKITMTLRDRGLQTLTSNKGCARKMSQYSP